MEEYQAPDAAPAYYKNTGVIFCGYCGENIDPYDDYCSQCGYHIDWANVEYIYVPSGEPNNIKPEQIKGKTRF